MGKPLIFSARLTEREAGLTMGSARQLLAWLLTDFVLSPLLKPRFMPLLTRPKEVTVVVVVEAAVEPRPKKLELPPKSRLLPKPQESQLKPRQLEELKKAGLRQQLLPQPRKSNQLRLLP